jgi:transcriptional antiterminator NusG
MTTENSTPEQPTAGLPPVPPPEAPPASADAPDVPSEPPPVTTDTPGDQPSANLLWYVVKVQSGREESIKEAIEKKVKIEGLQHLFGQIVIPTEKVSEMRKGKRYVRERKLLPGYLMVQVEFSDEMLYLFRDTSGVGDFVGTKHERNLKPGERLKPPLPMSENEVKKWIKIPGAEPTPTVGPSASPYSEGDRVKVKDGMFSGMEGSIKQVLETKGAVTVELTIFGRPVPVELEYWQVDFV